MGATEHGTQSRERDTEQGIFPHQTSHAMSDKNGGVSHFSQPALLARKYTAVHSYLLKK